MLAEPNWKELFASFKTIAVVGYSRNPNKPAHYVPAFMRGQGYTIIPVNPNLDEVVDGLTTYPDLDSIPPEIQVDVVNVFRRSEDTPPIAHAALQMTTRPTCFWMQLGISNSEARRIAESAGMTVIENTCMLATYQHHILGS